MRRNVILPTLHFHKQLRIFLVFLGASPWGICVPTYYVALVKALNPTLVPLVLTCKDRMMGSLRTHHRLSTCLKLWIATFLFLPPGSISTFDARIV